MQDKCVIKINFSVVSYKQPDINDVCVFVCVCVCDIFFVFSFFLIFDLIFETEQNINNMRKRM